ncbi:MAG TPA: hypothetical protein VGP89_17900 [Candidatus Angelobacter sp.]|jgi:hypothetical protein|nr:hypothetical protein [Candidatus Angelobacter sp.]
MPRNSRNIKEDVWDSSSLSVLFPASRSKVKTMLATGECVCFCKRCGLTGSTEAHKSLLLAGKRCDGARQAHDLSYKVTPTFRDVDQTPAAITANEMRALVGLKSARAQKAARIKLDHWQQCGMNLRVLPAPQPFGVMSPCPA